MTSALGWAARGTAASALGTLALDAFQYRRYRQGGGDAPFASWESSEGIVSWEEAPAPAQVAKKLLEAALRKEVPPRFARSLNNASHWGFGLANGAAYGLLVGPRWRPKVRFGPPFGAVVWSSGYVIFPLLGVYKPIWKYDLGTLWTDLSGHLVFGTTTAAVFRLM